MVVVLLGLEVEFPPAVASVMFWETTCWRTKKKRRRRRSVRRVQKLSSHSLTRSELNHNAQHEEIH